MKHRHIFLLPNARFNVFIHFQNAAFSFPCKRYYRKSIKCRRCCVRFQNGERRATNEKLEINNNNNNAAQAHIKNEAEKGVEQKKWKNALNKNQKLESTTFIRTSHAMETNETK